MYVLHLGCLAERFKVMMFYLNSQQRLFVRSRNPNDFWMKLDVKFQKTRSGHSFVRSIPFPGSLDFSLGKRRFKPSNGH